MVIKPDFHDALAAARLAGVSSFTDPETGTLIALDPQTGVPEHYSMLVRSLRLHDQAEAQRWHNRAKKFLSDSAGAAWRFLRRKK